jgi:predicted nucleotide-binding protein
VPHDPLRKALDERLGVSSRHVDRLIQRRANEQFLTRRLAMLSLARDANVNISRFATDEEMATLRGAERRDGPKADPVMPAATPALPSRTKERLERTTARENQRRRPKPKDPRKVVVVHGRDKKVRDALYQFLRSIGLDPIEWGQAMKATGKAQPSIPETVDAAFREGAAVVVLLTPDDIVVLAPRLRRPKEPKQETTRMGQGRPNVFFEAGLAFGIYPDATVLVSVGDVKPFSDVSGLHITRLDGGTAKRLEFIEKLKLTGAKVDIDGKMGWMTEGNFEIEEK